MASNIDTSDTFSKEDSLENLRTRGICPICKEFYIKPKRLDKCPHVFCLNCIRRHLQANSHVNFPGCPMCRRPILKPLSKINDLEPGRAEEDIVNFVKQYETCGLCDQKENPRLRCSECECFICENCKPSHSKLKPSHNVNPLMHSASYKRPRTKQMCRHHQNKSLDLFCFICQAILCSYCEKFSHGECQVRCANLLRFDFGFLQKYAKASELRTWQFNTGRLSRCVYLIDFVKEAKLWLENVKIALEECINVFKEYQSNIAAIVKDQFKPFASRIQAITNDSSDILEKSETLFVDIVKLLESGTDSEVAISVLHIEHKAVQLFRRRRKLCVEIRPLKIAFDKGVTFRQICTGYLHIPDGAFAGILCIDYSETYDQIYSEYLQLKTDNNCTDAQSNTGMHKIEIDNCVTVTVYHDIISVYEETERKVEPESNTLHYQDYLTNKSYFYTFRSSSNMFFSSNNMYTNEVLDSIKRPFPRPLQLPDIHTIDIGYEQSLASHNYSGIYSFQYRVRLDEKEDPSIVITLPSNVSEFWCFNIVTSFTNVLDVPFLFDVTGGYKPAPYSYRDKTPSLICFIGNRNSVSGLETVFLYLDDNILNSYGICLNTGIAKFNNLHPINSQEYQKFNLVKNKSCTFSFFSAHGVDLFMASYRTKTVSTSAQKHFLIWFDPYENSERIIPVTFETTSLFCSTKTGLYFAKHDNNLEVMTIGKMSFSRVGMETDVITSLTETDVGVPICKLKPLTMVENGDKDIVVVCAIENDKSNIFMMLWPYKEANGRIELLEVQYPPSVLSNASVVDLEMDPDGNIMYVLENQEGHCQSVCTKYFMPK